MITLIPYVKAEDGYTVTDDVLRNIWNKLIQDKTADVVFYDQPMRTSDEFISFMKSPVNLPVVILVKDGIAGIAWLNGVAAGFAFGHFALFKETWGHYSEAIGKRILDYWLTLGAKEPVLATIVGMIPSFNKRAIRYVERLGFIKLGEIPRLIQKKLDVVLLYYQGDSWVDQQQVSAD